MVPKNIQSRKITIFGFVHLLILPVVAALIFAAYLLWKPNVRVDEAISLGGGVINKMVSTPTPIPFEEITIPALRARSYSSKLGELRKYSENASYTSYVTSYDSDNLRVNGFLTIPKSEGSGVRYPAIVFVHGYIPPDEYRTTQNYISYVDYFARNGFVVFKIDLRGHDDSEGDPGGAYYSDDYVVDTLNAIEAIRSADFVDRVSIGLWGHSMAGNIVLRSFVVDKNIKAAVVWAGAGYTYSDLQEYMIEDTSYRPPPTDSPRAKERQRLREIHGTFDPKDPFWMLVPPTSFLDGVSGSIQIHHAIDDNVVSIEYGRNLIDILDNSEIKHELFEYPTGGHNLTGGSFTLAMERSIDFFRSQLK